ncbi:hypothetical protein LNKW23_41590 [Paralimibaculum aggregatum]|uniref:Uncharacterized protein n=1 Tax=Paralimibaculum aggregatum TaxID=3036245 RepID=A0ABQ6LRR5_9RHOB|nr:hypothetical protein [Limibaculum sp. NKW23]GMG84943.1 hypothetical protein LNKW23_41590 [Limibaculum sp. NKW23]
MATRFEIAAGMRDAALAGALRKALRRAGDGLLIAGDLSGGMDDARGLADWVGALGDAPVPVALAARGPLGPRGVALLLVADLTALAPGVAAPADWPDAPGAPALASRALGPAARALVLEGGDLVAALAATGRLTVADDPLAAAEARLAAAGPGAARRRASLTAAANLPLREALDFDLWHHRAERDSR